MAPSSSQPGLGEQPAIRSGDLGAKALQSLPPCPVTGSSAQFGWASSEELAPLNHKLISSSYSKGGWQHASPKARALLEKHLGQLLVSQFDLGRALSQLPKCLSETGTASNALGKCNLGLPTNTSRSGDKG